MFELDAFLTTRLWRIVPPSRHAPNFGFVVATRGDIVQFRLVNGRIVYVHYREVARLNPSIILPGIRYAREHLLNLALFSIHEHIVSPNIFDMDEFFRRLDHLQFILRITAETQEPDEYHRYFTG